MKQGDAATLDLDAEADTLKVDAAAADELFAVVDVLDAQPPLRRALSDPSAHAKDRTALAERLFGPRLGTAAGTLVTTAVTAPWPSGRSLVEALERQGVRGLFRTALDAGELARVQEELAAFASLVSDNAELGDSLRNRSYPLETRRGLVQQLAADRTHPITQRLLARATAARVRTLQLTVQTYLHMAAAVANQRIARVTVARPLDARRRARLSSALEKHAGGPVVLQIVVDPAVLGGMEIRLGDDIIESTVAGRLDDARQLLNTK